MSDVRKSCCVRNNDVLWQVGFPIREATEKDVEWPTWRAVNDSMSRGRTVTTLGQSSRFNGE